MHARGYRAGFSFTNIGVAVKTNEAATEIVPVGLESRQTNADKQFIHPSLGTLRGKRGGVSVIDFERRKNGLWVAPGASERICFLITKNKGTCRNDIFIRDKRTSHFPICSNISRARCA